MTAAATHGSLTLQANLPDVAGDPYLADYTAAKDGRDRPLSLTSAARSRSENRSARPIRLQKIMEQRLPPRIFLPRIRSSRLPL
jgi:hypothetical protein